jgi:tRNA uridine 5-carboxymethylaminomethyl modification enzyme
MRVLQVSVASELLRSAGAAVVGDGVRRSLFDWLRFAEVGQAQLLALAPELAALDCDVIDEIVHDGRYAPYLARQEQEISRLRADDAVDLSRLDDYRSIGGLSNEMVERLDRARPATLAAAARVRGVTPAALAAILVHARRRAA